MPMKKICKASSVFLSIILLFGLSTAPALASDNYSSRTISVFLPLQFGFAEQDENGELSGYTYEYLMRLAQLSGWRYKFITGSRSNEGLIEGLAQVENGDIDLVGTMVKPQSTEDSALIYSLQSYGATNFTLICKANNSSLNARTLHNWPDLKIAILENSAVQNKYLEQYSQSTGLKFTPVYASNREACLQLVRDGKADAAISKDATFDNGFKTITKIASQPFYFAASKENEALIKELDKLITSVNLASPDLQRQLHRKYFTNVFDYIISLTHKETEYIKSAKPIRIIAPVSRAPLLDYDAATGVFSGIVTDIINVISAKSGLEFEFIPAEDENSILSLLSKGEADMVAGISYDSRSLGNMYGADLLLTSPVFSSPIVRISNTKNKSKSNEALVYRGIKAFEDNPGCIFMDDISAMFNLVDSGEYKEAYVDGYMAQYYLEKSYLRNIGVSPTTYSNYQICLGAVRGVDLRLMNILEQTIAAISPEELERIVYTNTSKAQQSSIIDVFRRNPLPFIISITLLLAVIITLLSMLILKTKRINKIISEEKNRYKAISQTDQLTGTLNNASFKRKCSDYLSYSEEEPCGAVIMCDIDNFKNVNDLYGHITGDKVIKEFGSLLTRLCREDDIVGRLGGDEFGLLIKNVTDTELVSARCREILEKGRRLMDGFDISLSIGAAIFNKRASFEELLKRADTIMYDVKNDGKNSYKLYVYNGTDVNSRI